MADHIAKVGCLHYPNRGSRQVRDDDLIEALLKLDGLPAERAIDVGRDATYGVSDGARSGLPACKIA
jgi:hypothetical protein